MKGGAGQRTARAVGGPRRGGTRAGQIARTGAGERSDALLRTFDATRSGRGSIARERWCHSRGRDDARATWFRDGLLLHRCRRRQDDADTDTATGGAIVVRRRGDPAHDRCEGVPPVARERGRSGDAVPIAGRVDMLFDELLDH